ncbi:MAG: phosphatase PAP2 family protein, partial [Bdellovibrionaceae bacterium]|jgi:membrane-associated phospholipid phosphatase|nr:phosphatase PAP2 family protein [Pseudobdellovibrionaceae bacterium]
MAKRAVVFIIEQGRSLWGSLLLVMILSWVLVHSVDQGLCEKVHELREEQASWLKLAQSLTEVGDAKWYFYFLLALFFTWLLDRKGLGLSLILGSDRSPRIYRWGQQFLWSLLTAGFLVHLLKFSFGRKRPLTILHQGIICDAHHWVGAQWDWHFQSFPSGHSQLIFTIATFLFHTSLKNFTWKWGIWLLAGVVAMTRVVTLDHFLSDVLMGSWVGYWGARLGIFLSTQGMASGTTKDYHA